MNLVRRRRTQTGAASIAEFAVSLFIIFPVLLIMISIASALTGYLTVNFAAQTAAREAGSASTQADATTLVNNLQNNILFGGLGKFGGVQDGATLALAVEQAANGTDTFTPWDNVTVAPNNFVYRYKVTGNATIKPMLLPVTFQLQSPPAVSVVEHPQGLVIH
jgi:hypothetical protein